MPQKPLTACAIPGCPRPATRDGRCSTHATSPSGGRREQSRPRPSAAAQGYGRAWQRLRTRYLAAHPYCECGCGRRASHVDHVIPRSQGGTDAWENLQALAPGCHSRKTNRQDGGGWKRRSGQL